MKSDRKEYFQRYWKEHKEAHREAQRRYVEKNGREEYNKELCKEWYGKNKENKIEYSKEYKKTQLGRAHNLLAAYRKSDKRYNRGECTLTAKWIVDNIFSKKCQYCDETDGHNLGCDRIDNNLPHTIENVVPCCTRCNIKKH